MGKKKKSRSSSNETSKSNIITKDNKRIDDANTEIETKPFQPSTLSEAKKVKPKKNKKTLENNDDTQNSNLIFDEKVETEKNDCTDLKTAPANKNGKSKKKNKKHVNDQDTNETEERVAVDETEHEEVLTNSANKIVKSKKKRKTCPDKDLQKNKKIKFTDDDEPLEINNKKKIRNDGSSQEDDVKDEDIDRFCDELNEEDNAQYENWVKLLEAKLTSNKKKSK